MRTRASYAFTALALLALIGCASGPVRGGDQAPPVGPAPKVILGVFGGMGPEATANFYQLVVALTPATRDQEHIPTLIYSLPQVPDRTAAIRSGDPSIVPYLVEGVTRLEKAGASFIAIPCNTAHYYLEPMRKAVNIPILDMIGAAAEEVARSHPTAKRVGLLATSGTIGTGLYHRAFAARAIEVVTPDQAAQEQLVMKAVYAIKAGTNKREAEELLFRAGRELEAGGADVIVLGCTEIPLAFNAARSGVPVVNATRVLADRAIQTYRDLVAAAAPGK